MDPHSLVRIFTVPLHSIKTLWKIGLKAKILTLCVAVQTGLGLRHSYMPQESFCQPNDVWYATWEKEAMPFVNRDGSNQSVCPHNLIKPSLYVNVFYIYIFQCFCKQPTKALLRLRTLNCQRRLCSDCTHWGADWGLCCSYFEKRLFLHVEMPCGWGSED